MSHTKTILIWLGVTAFLTLSLGLYLHINPKENPQEQIFCTLDAMQCPDGSYVGREGPDCEFKKCPDMSTFKEYINEELRYSIKYPASYFVQSSNNMDCFKATEGGGDGSMFCIRFYENPQKLSAVDWWMNNPIESAAFVERKTINIAGENAIVFEISPGEFPDTEIIFTHNDKIIEIAGNGINNIILSSFKFLESDFKTSGTASGKVSIGPLCPVEPCTSNIDPYSGKQLIFKPTGGGRPIDSPFYAKLNLDGSYSIELPEANYSVTLSDCQYMGCSVVFPKNIQIQANKNLEINFDIDTGIR